jgi:hypothetical protein
MKYLTWFDRLTMSVVRLGIIFTDLHGFKLFYAVLLFVGVFLYGEYAELSPYVADAAQRPIAFSVVREDSQQDVEIVKRYFPEAEISMIMVASGGCTAAQLLGQAPLHDLILVDPNRAQLDLTKFKIHLLNFSCKKA